MKAKPVTKVVLMPTTVTSGASVDIEHMYETDKWLTVVGAMSATYKVKLSNDNSTWTQSGSDITAAGITKITDRAKYLKIECTAHASGSPTCTMFSVQSSSNGYTQYLALSGGAIDGTLTVADEVALADDLDVAGDTTCVDLTSTGNIACVDLATSDDLTVGDDLIVTGLATVGETLAVTGVTTLASAVVTGAATVGTTLDVTGVTTCTGGLVVAGQTATKLGLLAALPADGAVANGQLHIWVDSVANKLMFKLKYAAGTVKVGEIALT